MKLYVQHNAEIAHRLAFALPNSKCENIHGHSLRIRLTLEGLVDEKGLVAGLDFGNLKKKFRGYIDSIWDHKLHMSKNDPWAVYLQPTDEVVNLQGKHLPGLITWWGDPTTENMAIWMWNDLKAVFDETSASLMYEIQINETGTNGVIYGGE